MSNPIAQLAYPSGYGPMPAGFSFLLKSGFNVLVGQNDVGKTALLQWLFLRSMESGIAPAGASALILTDRFFVASHTRTEQTLELYNNNFRGHFSGNPKPFDAQTGPAPADLFAAILQRTDMMQQNQQLNELLGRVGFPPLQIKQAQVATLGNIAIHTHGAGIRCLLPILAVLTSPDIKYLFIDEPELSLEARAQKVLKQLLVESTLSGKTVFVATQSHLFLNRIEGEVGNNVRVDNVNTGFVVSPIASTQELVDLTYNLLGNSLEDLFFPNNFLIVEGASDQRIAEKAASLLGFGSAKVKTIAAGGIDNVEPSYQAIRNTLVPLITTDSPYAKKVVAFLDKPSADKAEQVEEFRRVLGDRLFVLDALSIEEYLPDGLYSKAGREKTADLAKLAELREIARFRPDERAKLSAFKKEISNAVAATLTREDLDGIPIMRDALIKASGG